MFFFKCEEFWKYLIMHNTRFCINYFIFELGLEFVSWTKFLEGFLLITFYCVFKLRVSVLAFFNT